jgi:hypothetical protein
MTTPDDAGTTPDDAGTRVDDLRAANRAMRSALEVLADYHTPGTDHAAPTGAACATCGYLAPCQTRRTALRALGPGHRAG